MLCLTDSTLPNAVNLPREKPTYHQEPFKNRTKILAYDLIPVPESESTILSAYYDNREQFYGPSIVLLGYQPLKSWNRPLYCTLYYSDGTVRCLSSGTSVSLADSCNKYIRYTTKISVFHVCHLPDTVVPVHVSLSASVECSRSSRKISIFNNHLKQSDMKDFGVCVQTPLYGGETLQNVYEFIEAHLLLGVSVFTLYSQTGLHKLTRSLETQYNNVDMDIIEWPSTFKRKNPVHYYGEILSIHDCLYRNMNRVKYLAFVDLDEVITPLKDSSWKEMIGRQLDDNSTNGFVFNNVLMATRNTISRTSIQEMQYDLCSSVKVPKYLQVLKRFACPYKHPRRSKVIVVPDKVSHLDIHSICYTKGYRKLVVPNDVGLVYHYRKFVPQDCKNRSLEDAKEWGHHKGTLLTNMHKRFCTK